MARLQTQFIICVAHKRFAAKVSDTTVMPKEQMFVTQKIKNEKIFITACIWVDNEFLAGTNN
jgi:hypothetical protein